ncbi:MAG: reductase [Actinomycetota bacterium]|jgi:FMN reductase
MSLVAVSAGESATSKTLKLVAGEVSSRGGRVIDLSQLDANGLLGRAEDHAVADAVAAAAAASVLVVATPIYRATYTGALKAFFDRFQTGALAKTAVVLVATAGIADHFLSLDTGGRALVASLEGTTVSKVVYAISSDFVDGEPKPELLDALRTAIDQAEAVAASL